MRSGVILVSPPRQPGRHLPFWVRRLSQFRLLQVTVFQTGVPLVSIDRKGSAISSIWLEDFARCPQASYPRLCRNRAHAAYPSHHYSYAALNEQHHRSLKGALEVLANVDTLCQRSAAEQALAADRLRRARS